MRNLKKFLALVLAMMMVFSLMLTVSAKTLDDYTDGKTVNPMYVEAVDVLTQLGIFRGSSNNFEPERVLTRGEVATLVYRVITGDVDDTQTGIYTTYYEGFTDVPVTHYAIGAVNYAANGLYVVGDGDGHFFPDTEINGYQLLAILLRVLGYGQNGEYQGPGWEIATAKNASELGLLRGLLAADSVDLGKGATRQVVAQVIYNAMNAELVKYSVGLAYTGLEKNLIDLNATLGEDDWGVPSQRFTAVWNKVPGHVGYATIACPKVAEFTVAMSDCDIYDNADFNVGEGYIVDWWLDGNKQPNPEEVSTQKDGFIDDLDVNDFIGGQGVLTQIYQVGAAFGLPQYRIVQINTWLAKVTKVTPAYTDPKGHPAPRTIDLEIWTGTRGASPATTVSKGHVSDAYNKGDYVLVYINKPLDQSPATSGSFSDEAGDYFKRVELKGTADPIGSGNLTTWTARNGAKPATSTVGDKALNENENFKLNWHQTTSNWVAYSDLYGNVIGLDRGTMSYVILEAISWLHIDKATGLPTVTGGYAAANLRFANSDEEPLRVSVAAIGTNGGNPVPVKSINATDPLIDGEIADNYKNNAGYYCGHLYTYSVNADGEYILTEHLGVVPTEPIIDVTDNTATVTQKSSYIRDGSGKVLVTVTDFTVFMVYDVNVGAYTRYVGKDAVPTRNAANICALLDEDGFATLVLVTGTAPGLGTSTLVAYVGDVTPAGSRIISGSTHYGYFVYPIGSIEPQLYYTDDDLSTYVTKTGLYSFTVDNTTGRIISGSLIVHDADKSGVLSGSYSTNQVRTQVSGTNQKGTSIFTGAWDLGTTISDATSSDPGEFSYNVRESDGLKVIAVTKAGNGAADKATELQFISVDDIDKNDVVIVVYTVNGMINNAKFVYVIKKDVNSTDPVAPLPPALIKSAVADIDAKTVTITLASSVTAVVADNSPSVAATEITQSQLKAAIISALKAKGYELDTAITGTISVTGTPLSGSTWVTAVPTGTTLFVSPFTFAVTINQAAS